VAEESTLRAEAVDSHRVSNRAIGEKYGEDARLAFDRDLQKAYRKASGWNAKARELGELQRAVVEPFNSTVDAEVWCRSHALGPVSVLLGWKLDTDFDGGITWDGRKFCGSYAWPELEKGYVLN
jgi:hypothetical protein